MHHSMVFPKFQHLKGALTRVSRVLKVITSLYWLSANSWLERHSQRHIIIVLAICYWFGLAEVLSVTSSLYWLSAIGWLGRSSQCHSIIVLAIRRCLILNSPHHHQRVPDFYYHLHIWGCQISVTLSLSEGARFLSPHQVSDFCYPSQSDFCHPIRGPQISFTPLEGCSDFSITKCPISFTPLERVSDFF